MIDTIAKEKDLVITSKRRGLKKIQERNDKMSKYPQVRDVIVVPVKDSDRFTIKLLFKPSGISSFYNFDKSDLKSLRKSIRDLVEYQNNGTVFIRLPNHKPQYGWKSVASISLIKKLDEQITKVLKENLK